MSFKDAWQNYNLGIDMSRPPKINKNEVECASCGTRRDQHNVKVPCPRFVEPVSFQGIPIQTRPGPGLLGVHIADLYLDDLKKLSSADIQKVRTNSLEARPYSPDEVLAICRAQIQEFNDALRRDFDRYALQLTGQIRDLEKRLERLTKQYSFDPQLHRAAKERTDYTRVFSDEEDGLEEGYRGWPTPKEKVIF